MSSPQRYELALDKPATGLADAFLLGNGWLGATAHGLPGTERVDVNVDTLWSGGPQHPAEHSSAEILPQLRNAIRERNDVLADALARQLQRPEYSQSYQPLGWIEWAYAPDSRATGYERTMNVASATASTSYETDAGRVTLETFVSAPDGVIVTTARGAIAGFPVAFRSPHPSATTWNAQEGWLTAVGRAPAHVSPNYVDSPDPVVYADDQPDADGAVPAGMGFALAAKVEQVASDEARVIVSAESGFRGYDARPSADLQALEERARDRVAAAAERSTAELRQRHIADYEQLFERADLDLSASGDDAARAEFYFHLGRHLLISSSRPGTQAATLQGIWNIDVRPGWSSNYTTNINVEMNYWCAELVGLPEAHEPLLELVKDLSVAGRSAARSVYGARGSAVHHNTDIWRFTTPVEGDPQWANWPVGLLWLVAHFAWHEEHSPASEVANDEVAVAVYREAVLFALDLLTEYSDGTQVTSPSSSPELSFVNTDGFTLAVSEGAAMDQELVRETLEYWVRLIARRSDITESDAALVAESERALARLRAVAFSADGELLEWIDERVPKEPGHRHVSHLYGLYPGLRIDEVRTPQDFDGARRALASRLRHGGGYTGWSSAWILNLAGRLRDAPLAEHALGALLGELSSNSMLDLHPHAEWPGGYIFQIDGNLGAVAGIAGLVVGRTSDGVSLLPALPSEWGRGQMRGVVTRGGHRVGLSWADGRLLSAELRAGRTGQITLDVPSSESGQLFDGRGAPVPTRRSLAAAGRYRVAFDAVTGETYEWRLATT